ncbi:uncharacterized protein EURHEDRAFT_466720 [Aspergillus ruber CBS 135680]|uniref:Uncharacterized protein n=1 Tax=Aspergillus ruber (strain CBS 135680) TaxID=1388766 RepID=A0A017S0U1_ASPRC|nr:uncharacterized protein EURHEDRAFT_466720 [Aspergillus ruber CBS 135680]EYE90648.1 hypothetical protein EURHEDRAFT_466720 [Aspergillus ruber CBS 135680]
MTTEQPPKQAAYHQPSNPITHNPFEQTRQRGDPVPITTSTTHRTANSKPSSDESLASLKANHQREQARKQGAPDVDLDYGVEQQPAEGAIADAVEHKGTRSSTRTQAGAHSGPVGSAFGPGYSGFGEDGDRGQDQMRDLGRKREEHDRVLGDRIGQSPPEPDEESADIRQQKLELDEQLNVKDAVKEATGDPVVGR